MSRNDAEVLVEAIEGLIRQIINDSRPAHDQGAKDDGDYRDQIIFMLTDEKEA